MIARPGSIDRAVRGSRSALLSHEQKATICIMAREAYDKVGKFAGQEYEEWRHEQQHEACGKSSLCSATQGDYRNIKGHFNALLGRTRAAFRDYVKAEAGNTGFALAKLRHELRNAADVIERPEEYIQRIARSRFKTIDLTSLSENQVWSLVYDIRRNAQRRRRKAA